MHDLELTSGLLGRRRTYPEFAAMSGFRRLWRQSRASSRNAVASAKTTEHVNLQGFMERTGIEPVTSGLQSRRSPS
jgi:hypothetical protein